jgi:hypothetical protein
MASRNTEDKGRLSLNKKNRGKILKELLSKQADNSIKPADKSIKPHTQSYTQKTSPVSTTKSFLYILHDIYVYFPYVLFQFTIFQYIYIFMK